jgi:hypothetical protein
MRPVAIDSKPGPPNESLGRSHASGRARRVLLASVPIASFAIGIVVVVFNRTLIPARFFYDSNQIHRLAASGNSSVDFSDPSYGSVAAVYRIVGLGDNALLAGLLTYLFAALVVYTAFRLRDFVITPAGAIAGSLALLVASVYLGTYSKDLFVLPIALVALRARNGWVGHVAVLVAVALYAHMFREYWYLNAGLYVVYLVVARPRVPRWVLLLLPVVALVALALIAYLGFGVDSDFARTQVNDIRQGTEDARTAITPFVDWPGPLAPMVNTVLTLFSIAVPLPLVLRGQLYYIAAAAAFVAIWVTFLLGVHRIRPGSVGRRCMLLILSVLTTQALFEPDYGSALRHLAPLLGVFTFCALHSRAQQAPSSRRDLQQELHGTRRSRRANAIHERERATGVREEAGPAEVCSPEPTAAGSEVDSETAHHSTA